MGIRGTECLIIRVQGIVNHVSNHAHDAVIHRTLVPDLTHRRMIRIQRLSPFSMTSKVENRRLAIDYNLYKQRPVRIGRGSRISEVSWSNDLEENIEKSTDS